MKAKIKARVMWFHAPENCAPEYRERAEACYAMYIYGPRIPVYVLRADQYDAMIEQMAKAGMDARAKRLGLDRTKWELCPDVFRENIRHDLRATLRAIGITKTTPDSAKKKRLRKDGESAS